VFTGSWAPILLSYHAEKEKNLHGWEPGEQEPKKIKF
jgi:hypothetical protein